MESGIYSQSSSSLSSTTVSFSEHLAHMLKSLSEVMEIPFNPFPPTTIFRMVVEEMNLLQYKLNAFAFVSLTARRLIPLKWKDETSPTYTH